MAKDLKVAMAYPAFYSAFKQFIPQLEPEIKPADVEHFDIIVFSGGEDVDPSMYGEKNEGLSWSNPDRDTREAEIFKMAWRLNKRMFGVCRGHQLINALTGGTLYQDLSLADGGSHTGTHRLKLINMHEILRYIPENVNSMHHQGIKRLSSTLDVYAMWNGVAEICIGRNESIITMQFHPEFMGDQCRYIFSWLLSGWKQPKFSTKSGEKSMSLEEIQQMEDARRRMEELHARTSARFTSTTGRPLSSTLTMTHRPTYFGQSAPEVVPSSENSGVDPSPSITDAAEAMAAFGRELESWIDSEPEPRDNGDSGDNDDEN